MRVLIAAVGYTNLRDLSIGPVLIPTLRQLIWPPGIEIEDLSFGPIAVVQQFQDQPYSYDRIVFVAAVERARQPGQIYCYRWPGLTPDPEEVQQRINEAVTGVISLDNLLIIAQHFDVLPSDVVVVEVEPEDTGWGLGFSPRVEAAKHEMIKTIKEVAVNGYKEIPA